MEQNAKMTLSVAKRAYIMKTGEIVRSRDTAADSLNEYDLMQDYMGI